MVGTRSRVRACSPTKTDSALGRVVQATSSTGRRTRNSAKQPESPTHQTVVDASSQLEKVAGGSPLPASARKRCSKASRLHSPDKPSTPVGSVHEGDASDVDSCCSAVSDINMPVTRRRTRRLARSMANQEDDVSEVESCSSAVSASRVPVRRSTRKKKIPDVSDSAAKVKDDEVEVAPETEPCTPSVSESQSRRRTRTRTADISQTEDSDADSVTGDVSKSTMCRSTRTRRQVRAIPIHLEETSEGSLSPAPTARRTRATRGKAAIENVNEPLSCDSEGFEFGPTSTRIITSGRKSKVLESDSDLTDVGNGSPSSSRTRSGSSPRLASKRSPKGLSVVLAQVMVPADEDASFNDSRLESTIIVEDSECTLLEEDENTESGEVKECGEVKSTQTKQKPEDSSLEKSSAEAGYTIAHDLSIPALDKAVGADEPAVTAEDQKEEPSADSKVDNSEMEMMQETVQSSEPLKPLQAASVTTTCDSEVSENKDEAMEVANVDIDDNKKPLNQEDDVEIPEGDKMEDSSVTGEAQQVVCSIKGSPSETEQHQEEPLEGTSSQESTITVNLLSEQPQDAVTKNTISLLDSSEDEDEYAEDGSDNSADEEEGDLGTESEEERPQKMKVAKSVEGLFMIDTRPGHEADELYYKDGTRMEEKATQEDAALEEDDEDFVDEEGDDDDEEGADILFSSRNPHCKELSSRIDPGIRMKELGGLYITFDGSKSKPVSSSQQKLKQKKIQEEVMKKSVIGPDFEKKDAVAPYKESKYALKLKRRAEREKTTGDAWFNMKAPEITQELKGDLQLLKMRGSMDPKRFYKKNDREGLPKYFQMGTVVDSPVDFYHSRIPKKERKRTMVEELLADAEFRHKNKKKFQTIMAEKAAQGAGRRRKMKNKFHKK